MLAVLKCSVSKILALVANLKFKIKFVYVCMYVCFFFFTRKLAFQLILQS